LSTEIFIASEQPETCRECGTRTKFVELSQGFQFHRCPNCKYSYLLEFEQFFCEKCQSADVFEGLLFDKKFIECVDCKQISHYDFC